MKQSWGSQSPRGTLLCLFFLRMYLCESLEIKRGKVLHLTGEDGETMH